MTPTPTWPIFSHQDLENATRWALETAVPLSTELSSSPLEDFWKALRTGGDGGTHGGTHVFIVINGDWMVI